MVLIQYMFGIPSMRQTVSEIEVNLAYRWFLGFGFYDEVPHFSTFGKNYMRRFAGTDLFERIFMEVLFACKRAGFVKEEAVYIDATHIKANANKHKSKKRTVKKEAYEYTRELKEEINRDRETHGKEPFDDDDDPLPKKNRLRRVQRTRKAGCSLRGSMKGSLPTMCRQPVMIMELF